MPIANIFRKPPQRFFWMRGGVRPRGIPIDIQLALRTRCCGVVRQLVTQLPVSFTLCKSTIKYLTLEVKQTSISCGGTSGPCEQPTCSIAAFSCSCQPGRTSLISEPAFQRQGSLLEGLLAKDRQTFPTALHELPARPLLTQDL